MVNVFKVLLLLSLESNPKSKCDEVNCVQEFSSEENPQCLRARVRWVM